MPKIKALVLFSGGLDSMLAVKLLQAQDIEVDGVCFVSNFFNYENAKKAAENLGIKFKIIDISEELLEIVKNPPCGYGKNLNPCIDCHSLMAREAGEIAKKEGYEILATGEVLGQRPFSQTKEALARVERLAGVEMLRPLSAKKLLETEYEKQGLVNRGRLKNISGRSRGRQMELAEKYDLKGYATPAGGCLLTDPEFSQRLLIMLGKWLDCSTNDVELLKHGRVFWITLKDANLRLPDSLASRQAGQDDAKKRQKVLVVVGRHEEDNDNLEKLAQKGDVVLELKEIAGPLTVVRNLKFQITNNKQIPNSKFQIPNIFKIDVPEKLKMSELKLGEEKSEDEILQIAGLLTGHYATKARGKKVKLEVTLRRQGSGGQGS